MAKTKKQKANARKRTTTRKRAPMIDAVDNDVLAAFETLRFQTGGQQAKNEIQLDGFADVTEERASILSIVKGLEGQVETAFSLKDVLETELNATHTKLSEQLDARAQLEVRVSSLEVQAALAEQLCEDISFAEEERNKFANLLEEIQPQFDEAVAERDTLADKMVSSETYTKELEDEKIALEAQVMNLKDKTSDLEDIRGELADMTKVNEVLNKHLRDFKRCLKTSEESRVASERELAVSDKTAQTLSSDVEVLQGKLIGFDNLAAELRIQLENQQAANKKLMESQTRLENEMKTLKVNYEAARKELDVFKNAMRDIRSEATKTSGRVRQRYFKPKTKSKSKK